jgi:hypothetical protein
MSGETARRNLQPDDGIDETNDADPLTSGRARAKRRA